jgi:carboxyl-terminal processing protease
MRPEQGGLHQAEQLHADRGQEVRNALKELKEQGAKKMILDLRGNGGGLLREAVNIVNLFVPKNELVVETKGKIPEWDKTYKTLSEPVDAHHAFGGAGGWQ